MNKKYIGIEFSNCQGVKMKVESFLDKFNMYYVTYSHMGSTLNELMNEQDIEFYLSKQDELNEQLDKAKLLELKRQEEEEQEKQAYENVNGFCDNMKPMQKAKTLTVLNKLVSYNGKYTSRKEHMETMLKEGYKPFIIDKVMTSNRKINLERIVKYKYDVPVMQNSKGEFLEVTKTEYNYAIHLQNTLMDQAI